MPQNLFVYGTLMVPEIWHAVTGLPENSTARPANLRGYQRRRVEGADFPGIFASKSQDDVVHGCVYENITAEVFDRLDRYEDHFYQRVEVVVEVVDSEPASLPCQAFIIPASGIGILSDDPWDPETFRENSLERYLEALGIS